MPVLPSAAPKRASTVVICLAVSFFVPATALHGQVLPTTKPEGAKIESSLSAEKATSLLADLAKEVDACMTVSKPVLLGSRDPAGPSCVTFVDVGQVKGGLPPLVKQNPEGGPGMRMGAAYLTGAKSRSPKEHYAWHQVWLRVILDACAADNREVAPAASDLARKAKELARGINAWTVWQDGFTQATVKDSSHWPGHCLKSLNAAVAAKDLPAAKHWADELASAAFTLADLHRWLGFLLENSLTALEFQAKGESLFTWADRAFAGRYNPMSHIDLFPAGMLVLHGVHNYLEVERQAELLYQVPKDYLQAAHGDLPLTSGSVWMPPNLRANFLALRSKLSEANKAAFDLAARSPFERSYLANMLFRATQARTTDQLAVVLERFNKFTPEAEVSELMSVLMYRGNSFAGIEWGDRFDPRLMKAAGDLAGDDEEVLLGAYRFTNALYGGFENYKNVLTLRQALDQKKMDCVRSADMVAALFRNAGRAPSYHIRWCSGVEGHTVPAAEIDRDGKRKVVIVDALADKPDKLDTWPDAYFHGHPWPPGLQKNPEPYAVELYGRGLDNYVWLEGYIVRDNNAGLLMKAAVPYLPGRGKLSITKAFEGPYPQMPKEPEATVE